MANITKILLRQDTKENWENANPILNIGEPGIALKNGKVVGLKIGDGVSDWNHLDYYIDDPHTTVDEITELQTEVAKLDLTVYGDDNHTGLETTVNNLNDEINDATTGISTKISTLESAVANNIRDIETLTSNVNGLTTNLAGEIYNRGQADETLNYAIAEVGDIINTKVPNPPSEGDELIDGTYILKCTVLNHIATYSWELYDDNSPL